VKGLARWVRGTEDARAQSSAGEGIIRPSAPKTTHPHVAPERTAAAVALTQLVLSVFRLNSELITSGDRMTKDLRLSSARWQIFGAISHEELTASQIARNMGLYRQAVQPLVDALADDGLVEFIPNPNHQRAKLIRMTVAGRKSYVEALARQAAWANDIATGISEKKLTAATTLLRELQRRVHDSETGIKAPTARRRS
jgi:DNA-binding MarR family transcriptional regulator